MIVYADVLFALNWVMDYAALFAAARVLGLAQNAGGFAWVRLSARHIAC